MILSVPSCGVEQTASSDSTPFPSWNPASSVQTYPVHPSTSCSALCLQRCCMGLEGGHCPLQVGDMPVLLGPEHPPSFLLDQPHQVPLLPQPPSPQKQAFICFCSAPSLSHRGSSWLGPPSAAPFLTDISRSTLFDLTRVYGSSYCLHPRVPLPSPGGQQTPQREPVAPTQPPDGVRSPSLSSIQWQGGQGVSAGARGLWDPIHFTDPRPV